MAKNIKKEIKTKKQVSYLGKDFDSLRSDLIRFASTHYADKIADFTENGFGGMMIDMAAYVGDVMSYYMDHQFNELDLRTAIQDDNVEKLITAAGLDIVGASPSNVIVDFVIKVPAAFVENEYFLVGAVCASGGLMAFSVIPDRMTLFSGLHARHTVLPFGPTAVPL